MWTGRQTLGEIEGAIAKLHQDESQLDTALESATAKAEQLRKDRGDAFRELARIKLGEIEAGRLVRNLDAAERRAVQILESRRLRMSNANEQRTAAITELEKAEAERNTAAVAVEVALAAVEKVRLAAETQVKTTPAWTDASKVVEAADATAGEAEKKAAQSEDELGRKKKPYDDDPLFAYLWANGFGTARYQAGNITRMLDRRIADFIDFPGARANYAMLTEIQLRLREHATAQRAQCEDHRHELADLERKAMLAAGIEPLERTLAEARHRLAAADDTAEKKRAAVKTLDEQRNVLVNGTGDAAYTEALRTIASADAQNDIETLRREALRTVTPDDDAMVKRIAALDDAITGTDQELAGLRHSAQDLGQRRQEVEQVRDRFRSVGYDHPNATFGNEVQIGGVLSQILEGVVRSGILWDLLRGGFGTRPSNGRPDFGSPSFPFPFPMPGGGGNGGARGGEWRQPGTRGGWSPPFDSGGGGGSSGGGGGNDDGFSTGGSF